LKGWRYIKVSGLEISFLIVVVEHWKLFDLIWVPIKHRREINFNNILIIEILKVLRVTTATPD